MFCTLGFRAVATIAAVLPAFCLWNGAAVAQQEDEFPATYYLSQPDSPQRAGHRSLEGKPAPAVAIKEWIGEGVNLAAMKGHVIVVDFWGTWCGPCMRSVPHNIELVEKYADQGLVFIGVHDAGKGWDKAPQVVREKQMNYPVGLDDGGNSARAWKVAFWPTYGVIDKSGKLRALGLTPDAVEPVVKKLLAESETGGSTDKASRAKKAGETTPSPKDAVEVQSKWLEGTSTTRRRLDDLLARDSAPPLDVDHWVNSDPMKLADLKGKVVLLLFCSPSRDTSASLMVKCSQLYEKHKDDGLMVIGVAFPAGAERSKDIADKLGIQFPMCVDAAGKKTIDAYKADSAPDCYIIDRSGRVGVADCKEQLVEEAVEAYLRQAPSKSTDRAKKGA